MFISYVREDRERADRVQAILENAGVPVWRDTTSLWPGEDWKQRIRLAITEESLVFLACFSTHGNAKRTSYQREELLLAIDQFRQRAPDLPWLVPVRFDDCELPLFDLGAGRTLDSLQRVDFFDGQWSEGARRLVSGVLRIVGAEMPDDRPMLSAATVRQELPADIHEFTGRGDEVGAVLTAVRQGVDAGKPVLICAIDGMAGVGKTTLAVHAAHVLASRFPDGQFFLALHAHTPQQQPVEPGDALAALLRTTGMDPGQIPADVDERERQWRAWAAGRRFLLVLDDAANRAQVRPLIPGTGGCAVLVTSRRRLGALAGAFRLGLDILPSRQAAELLSRLSGRGNEEPEAVARLVALAGGLPLAIRLLGASLEARQSLTVSDLVGELAARSDRSAAIGAADNEPVSDVFDLSYHRLLPNRQRFFRRLALHPGSGLDAYAAAALTGLDLDQSRTELDALFSVHLIDEPGSGLYRFHDLVGDYAHALVRTDAESEQKQAIDALLSYYLAAMQRAGSLLNPQHGSSPRTGADHGHKRSRKAKLAQIPPLQNYEEALRWCDDRREALVACVSLAASHGHHELACRLAASLRQFLSIKKYWDDWKRTSEIALSSARKLKNSPALEARILRGLASLYCDLHLFEDAVNYSRQALAISGNNKRAQASALVAAGQANWRNNAYEAARTDYDRALTLYRDENDRKGQLIALDGLGEVHRAFAEYDDAIRLFEEALAIASEINDVRARGDLLNDLGQAYQGKRLFGDAIRCLNEALAIRRSGGDAVRISKTLEILGQIMRDTGRIAEANKYWSEAYAKLRKIGAPHAEDMRVLLDALNT